MNLKKNPSNHQDQVLSSGWRDGDRELLPFKWRENIVIPDYDDSKFNVALKCEVNNNSNELIIYNFFNLNLFNLN
jgi:hypothetical protein